MTFSLLHIIIIIAADNLALGEKAVQDSTFDIAYASLAVDGDVDTHSCTLTNSTETWWAVDLGWKMNVSSVTVTNENDNEDWGE